MLRSPLPSLRTADAFPDVASLPPKNRERSDDRKCVCCSQATLSYRSESPVSPSKIPCLKSSLVCMMRAFIGACAPGCLPLASTLRVEQKGMRNLHLNVEFFGVMCRWFVSNFIQFVLCFKMSQSVQVFGRKVSKKWTIFWLFYVDQTDTCIVNLTAVQLLVQLAYVKPVVFDIELCSR